MNTEKVIQKCNEFSEVTVKPTDYGLEMRLNGKDGSGSMRFIPLFDGVTLAYISIHAASWPAPELSVKQPDERAPFIINYCVRGRCEITLNTDQYVFLTPSQLSLTESYAQKEYRYPLQVYEGVEIFIDPGADRSILVQLFGIDPDELAGKYCPHRDTFLADASAEAQNAFLSLWKMGSEEELPILHMKTRTIELFSLLLRMKTEPGSSLPVFYTRTQIEIAQRTEKIITEDLSGHYPAKQLAQRFSVSETSLKNYFRGVFGQNISDYLREKRMNAAAELLVKTSISVAEVAERVGYLNQSKFAAVFKKQYGKTPLDYRRLAQLGRVSQIG